MPHKIQDTAGFKNGGMLEEDNEGDLNERSANLS